MRIRYLRRGNKGDKAKVKIENPKVCFLLRQKLKVKTRKYRL